MNLYKFLAVVVYSTMFKSGDALVECSNRLLGKFSLFWGVAVHFEQLDGGAF